MIHKPGAHHPWDMNELADNYESLRVLANLVQTIKHATLTPARKAEVHAQIAALQEQGLIVLPLDMLAAVKRHRDARNG